MSETKEDIKPKTEEEPKADEAKEEAKEVEGEKKEEAKDTTVKEETKKSSGDDEDKTKESSEGDDSKEDTKDSSEGDDKEETKKPSEGDDKDEDMKEAKESTEGDDKEEAKEGSKGDDKNEDMEEAKDSTEGDDKEEAKEASKGDDKDEDMEEAKEAKEASEEQKDAGKEDAADKKPEKKKRGRPPKVKTDGDKQGTTTPKKRTETATPTSQPSSSKRQRKATTFLEPKNFKSKPTAGGLHIPKGRGPLFSDIAFIKDSISKKKANDPILGELHKFLLGGTKGLLGKGRTPQKNIKPHILSFSGYLPNEIEGDTKEEKEVIESEINERFEVKAAKLKLPLLKAFFDLLGLDRSPVSGKPQSKGELVDNLLDFLADPDEESVCKKGKKKRGRPAKVKTDDEAEADKKTTKKKRKKKEVVESEEESDDESEEDDKDGKPSAKKLQKWVKAYVTCFNLDKATAKHAVQTASDKFGVDMSDRKKDIMDILKEAMLKV